MANETVAEKRQEIMAARLRITTPQGWGDEENQLAIKILNEALPNMFDEVAARLEATIMDEVVVPGRSWIRSVKVDLDPRG